MPLLKRVFFCVFSLALIAPAQEPSQAVLEKAWNLAGAGHRTEAIALLEALTKREPREADAQLLLGSLLMEANDKAGSIEHLKAAVALRPQSFEAANALGEAYHRFGDLHGARTCFEKAIALKPDYGVAQSNMGQVLFAENDLTGAAKHLDRAIDLLGSDDDAADALYLRARIALAQNDPALAENRLEHAIRIRPRFAEAWSDLGQVRKQQLNDAGAVAAFRKAVELNPRDAVAQYRLGAEYLKQGDTAAALGPLRQAYALDPSDQSVINSLQIALRQSGSVEEANRLKQQLAQLLRERDLRNQNKLAAVRINNEGAALEASGNIAAALAKYQRAITLDPDHDGIRRNLAIALLRTGHWKEGLEELHTLVLKQPDDAQLRAALQDALAQAPAQFQPSWKSDYIAH